MLPEGVRAVVKKDSYPVLPIFRMLQKEGNIAEEMMYNTFNMGLGMIVAVDPADVDAIAKTIQDVLSDQQAALKMGENGRAAVLNKYNWGIEEEKLFALYKKLQKGLS